MKRPFGESPGLKTSPKSARQSTASDVASLQRGRETMAKRCREVAEALIREAGVREVVYNSGTLSGRAYYEPRRIKVPEPTTRRRLVIFPHECAHIAIGPNPSVPRHRNEYDAERWAQAALRRHGIPVPKKEQERAKRYVAWKIAQAIRRGAKSLDREAFAWCKDHLSPEMQTAGEKLLSRK